MTAADPNDVSRGRYVTVALPRDALAVAVARPGLNAELGLRKCNFLSPRCVPTGHHHGPGGADTGRVSQRAAAMRAQATLCLGPRSAARTHPGQILLNRAIIWSRSVFVRDLLYPPSPLL
jgi:hypothetical protein